MKVVIPGELPALNEIINASKTHYQAYRKMKKINTNKVRAVMQSVPAQEKVYLKIDWYCKNKRKDTDNIAVGKKFILDGMVEAGVIKNDGWKEILGFRDSFYVDKDNPRIEVFIHGTDPDKQKDI